MTGAAAYMHANDVASYRTIIGHITPALRRPGSRGVYPVAVIFGSPACKAMKEDILPSLAYFNFRSGEALDMFCIGYTVPQDTMVFAPENFDQKAFHLAIMEFEERSRWQYSGETDLFLLNAYQYEEAGRKHVDLDFGTVFNVTLENAVKDGLIRSTRQYLEELMRYARDYKGDDLAGKVSDKLFLKKAGGALMNWTLSLLKVSPQDAGNIYRTCVHDYSRGQATA